MVMQTNQVLFILSIGPLQSLINRFLVQVLKKPGYVELLFLSDYYCSVARVGNGLHDEAAWSTAGRFLGLLEWRAGLASTGGKRVRVVNRVFLKTHYSLFLKQFEVVENKRLVKSAV